MLREMGNNSEVTMGVVELKEGSCINTTPNPGRKGLPGEWPDHLWPSLTNAPEWQLSFKPEPCNYMHKMLSDNLPFFFPSSEDDWLSLSASLAHFVCTQTLHANIYIMYKQCVYMHIYVSAGMKIPCLIHIDIFSCIHSWMLTLMGNVGQTLNIYPMHSLISSHQTSFFIIELNFFF